MKIVEFRIPIPLRLPDYQRCSIHLLIEASIREMEGGSGLEIFRNEKFKSNERIGYYTEKRYHLAKNLPNWLQSILGTRLTILTEKSWNLYPKLFTRYFNEVFPTAEFSLQTDNLETLEISENVFNLNSQDMAKRQVVFVDLTKFSKLKNYDPNFDLLKVSAGDFLPLKNEWYKDTKSVGIVSYKLLRLNIPYFGMLSSKIENYVVNFLYESMIYYTSMGLSRYEKWKDLTLEGLRATEVECYGKLNEAFRNNYSKMLDKNLKLAPVSSEKGKEIQIPKEISPLNLNSVTMPLGASSDSLTTDATSSALDAGTNVTDAGKELDKEVEVKGEVPKLEAKTPDGTAGLEVLKAQPGSIPGVELESEVTKGDDSVRSVASNETFKGSSALLGSGVELPDKVVVNPPQKDIGITELEMAGPVPVMSYDDADFKDAVENLEDLEDYEEQPGKSLFDAVSSVLKFVSRSQRASISESHKDSRKPSIDQATQVDSTQFEPTSDAKPEAAPEPSGEARASAVDREKKGEPTLNGAQLESEAKTPRKVEPTQSSAPPPDPKGAPPPTSNGQGPAPELKATTAPTPRERPEPPKGGAGRIDKKDSFSYDIPITFTGYLFKLGRGFSSWSWNMRYIIVCGFNLYYFDRKNDVKPKDTINLKNSRISWAGPHMSRPFVFSITTEAKDVYFWSADEEESVKRWILLLQVLCEESPPYIVKQLAYELTYHQNNSENVTGATRPL